jgi:hypothetical protein
LVFNFLIVFAPSTEYGIMVDAGPSETQAHIYNWNSDVQPISTVSEAVLKQKIPISKAHKNITLISDIFEPIIQFIVDKIPPRNYPKHPIFVYANSF